MASQPYSRARELSASAHHAQALLERYPDISDQELATLISTLAELPLLDFGLLAADERMDDKLNAFHADHGDKLRPPLSGIVWAIAVPVLIVSVALVYAIAT